MNGLANWIYNVIDFFLRISKDKCSADSNIKCLDYNNRLYGEIKVFNCLVSGLETLEVDGKYYY